MSTGRLTLGKMSGISHCHAYAKARNSSTLGGSLEQIFLSFSFHIDGRDKSYLRVCFVAVVVQSLSCV